MMNTKTIKIILFILSLSVPIIGQAQISPKVRQSFPAHIIFNIDKVVSKVKLSEDKQMQLGKSFAKKDSLANVHIRRIDTVIDFKSYNAISYKFLESILSQEELEDYLSQVMPNNRVLLALKSAKELKLDAKQIEQIRKQINVVATMPKMNDKEKMLFYDKKLDSILKKPQYGSLLKIIYDKETRNKTQADWKNILKLKLATPKDSIMFYSKIYQYNLVLNSVLDNKAGKYDIKKKNNLKEKIDLKLQPTILIWYAIASNGVYKKNLFSESIKYQKEINLTAIQIDSLLSNYKKIEQLKYNEKSQYLELNNSKTFIPTEYTALAKILDPRQITILLFNKNQKLAAINAENDWRKLEKLGLTKDLDKVTNIREFAKFHLQLQVVNDRQSMDNNKINVFNRRDILLKKPLLLKQLDDIIQNEQKNKSTKNELRW